MLSKSAARAFFLSGTLLFSAVFIWLTVDTFQRIPEQTNSGQLTESVVRGKQIWEENNCMGCHTLLGEGAYYAPELTRVYDRQADLMARRHPDPRIYVRRKLHDSELAMLILIDASLSSDSWVSGKRIFDIVRDSAQVLLESFEPTSAKLCVSAFYSNTRRDCRFVLAKGFEESAQKGLRRLHAVSPAGYTRIGPALRHSLQLMEQSGARRRLILLLTDAKPTDYDHYEGRYGIEDVRQALREASEKGVHCLTLAVRDHGAPYLTQMFGPQGWMLLPDARALPSHFISVANDFLRS